MKASPKRRSDRRHTGSARQRHRRRRSRAPIAVAAALALAAGIAAVVAVSGDGGQTGRGVPLVGGDLHSLVVDPRDARRIYVGGHDAVSVSRDGGATWREIESLRGADAMGWAFVGGRVLVAGHPGLHVSDDGGRTFELRNAGLPSTDVHALGAGDGTIYAASPAVGVFASTDGARTWELRSEEAGRTFMGAILVDPDDPEHLVASDMQAGAVTSADGGRTWRAMVGFPGAMWVTWAREDTDRIVVSGAGQALATEDGGRSWEQLGVPTGTLAVEVSPSDPELLYAAAHSVDRAELHVSRDGGATWATP